MCIVYFRFVQHHVFFTYRLAFSAITRNIMTLNLLHTKIFNYLIFRNVQNFIHMKIFTYTVLLIRLGLSNSSKITITVVNRTLFAICDTITIWFKKMCYQSDTVYM